MKTAVVVDDAAFHAACKRLDSRETRKAVRSGTRKTLNTVKAALVAHVKTYPHDAVARRWTRYGYTHFPPFYKDLRVSLFRKKIGGSIGLIGSRRKTDRTYILRFFNADSFGRNRTAAGQGKRRAGLAPAFSDPGFFERITSPAMENASKSFEDNIKRAIVARFNKTA